MIDGRRGRPSGRAPASHDEPPGAEATTVAATTSAEGTTTAEAATTAPEATELGVQPGSQPEEPRSRLAAFVALTVRLGVTANQVTVAGLVVAAATGVAIALGHMWIGIVLVTAGGLMDTLDGAIAKRRGTSSKRGAFFDSVSDRVADGLIFGGLAWYFASGHDPRLALLPLAILAVGNVISYERAKAESLGYIARGGLMERAERLIMLCCALTYHLVLVPILFGLLGLCVLTAVQRFVKVWRQAGGAPAATAAAAAPAGARIASGLRGASWRPGRVESRWRTFRESTASARRPRVAPVSRARARRRQEPLSTRLRRVLETERAVSRGANRQARRNREGASAALRRRLGAGR